MKKSFVLDTNVLLHNPAAIESFADNEVVIPMDVIEELDRFKGQNNELGRNARQVIRTLDRLRSQGSLRDGVTLKETGGAVRVALEPGSLEDTGLRINVSDNRIVAVANAIKNSGRPVIFVSKDVNARIKSDALGIKTMDFEKEKVDFDTLYGGWREVSISGDTIDQLYARKLLPTDGFGLIPNEFGVLRDAANPKHTALARCAPDGKSISLLRYGEMKPMGVAARNMEQRMAIELLCSEEVQLVTLVGQAGTGKTLLALACGLAQVMHEHRYDKVLVSRPIMPLGKDIGYLPGSVEEKLGHWMLPIYDNLEYILTLKGAKAEMGKKVEDFLRSGVIELEALTYIRGRSIPREFMIVDEAQNLTPHEVKTIVSRAGEDTKVVLTGDPYQIDNPYLDASSNGLTYTAERLKGKALFGHVTLTRSERSDLASLAAAEL
jgi:PhoH-like ATPase